MQAVESISGLQVDNVIREDWFHLDTEDDLRVHPPRYVDDVFDRGTRRIIYPWVLGWWLLRVRGSMDKKSWIQGLAETKLIRMVKVKTDVTTQME